jgi:hypothetical protein
MNDLTAAGAIRVSRMHQKKILIIATRDAQLLNAARA